MANIRQHIPSYYNIQVIAFGVHLIRKGALVFMKRSGGDYIYNCLMTTEGDEILVEYDDANAEANEEAKKPANGPETQVKQ